MTKETQIQTGLKTRMEEFRAALKDEDKKQKLFEEIPGSEVTIRFDVFLPSDDPEQQVDGLVLQMGDNGEIINADYYFRHLDEIEVCPLEEDELTVIKDLFGAYFTLEVE